jgi:MFS transporter, DHA1 family, multidrug resistance protein
VISGFAVPVKGWRWSLWPILWLNAPIFIAMFFFMPETYGPNILYRRARRLRKVTGNQQLQSKSEIDQKNMTFSQVAMDQLVKPFEITIKDPAVLFVNLYTAFVYGVYYGYFEGFPLAYPVVYGFNIGETSLTFLSFSVGCVIAAIFYASLWRYFALPNIMKNGPGPQEDSLIPALLFSALLPAGMFWWAWTIDESIHWIVSILGMVLFTIGAYVLMQCIFTYLPMSYPQYAASLFAANDFLRSSMATGAIIWGHPLYMNLGIGRGASVLAGLLCGGVLGVWALWYFGAGLRKRSKFAVS